LCAPNALIPAFEQSPFSNRNALDGLILAALTAICSPLNQEKVLHDPRRDYQYACCDADIRCHPANARREKLIQKRIARQPKYK
jgi:hypothetical protein